MILWIIIGILWTAFIVIISLLCGMTFATRNLEEKLAKSKSAQSLLTNESSASSTSVLTGPPGPPGAVGATGPTGMDGKTPDASDLIVDPDLEMSLAEWYTHVSNRLTRVERKAGMSV